MKMIVLVLTVIGLVFLNVKLNDLNEDSCKAKGGEYYRALKVSRSLCKVNH